MRKRMAWALGTGLALGLGTGFAQASDDPPPAPPAPTSGWVGPFKDWNTPAPKPEAKKKTDAPKHVKLTPAQEAQAASLREQADLLRRLAVCDKLREVAMRNSDQDLLRKVEQLEERVNNIYAEHAAVLAKVIDKSSKGTAVADATKLTDKKDAAPSVAAKGETP